MDLTNLNLYDFNLPKELIAQSPASPRDTAKLMVIKGETIEHRIFREITDYLNPSDILVLNDSKVIKAKLLAKKESGGKANILLVDKINETTWKCLIEGKKIKEGSYLFVNDIKCKVLCRSDSFYVVEFPFDAMQISREHGTIPLPPYIKSRIEDESLYQTVYARKEGSIAAPTAGFHFTPELLNRIKNMGIEILYITLHVGYGTFSPVKVTDIREHKMHEEYFEVSREVSEKINSRDRDSRVIAVGTTTLRALESSSKAGVVYPYSGKTNLFIYPGYNFQSPTTALVTNFHLPKSTLIMLVCAFGGYERIMNAYKIAIEKKYRFFSFGDAMLIFRD